MLPVPPEHAAAAQVWLDPEQDTRPVTPADAAGVVLVRDGPAGLETYLTVHDDRSPFGRVGFPAGRVLPSDDDPLPWSGPTGQDWGRMWHDDVGSARRCAVAAARELFTSVGVLLAGHDTSSTVLRAGGHDGVPSRQAIVDGRESFAEVLRRRRLLLRTELLRPLARWVSPQFVHRRVDVRFHLAILPDRQEPVPLDGQSCPGGWFRPADALRGIDLQALCRAPAADETVPSGQDGALAPATLLLLEDLADAGSAIEAAARRVDPAARSCELRRGPDGEPELVVSGPTRRGARR